MKKTLIVTIAVLVFALRASALDIKAITSKPTADNPQYKDKKAWPDLVGDEYFLKQKWDKAERLLIWAHPGEKQSRRRPRHDPANPTNWIDAATGKPAESVPDMNTDIIFPDSDTEYQVADVKPKSWSCRHLTVGRGAKVSPTRGASLSLFGNLWIRPQGNLYVYRTLKPSGSSNTFIRKDWPKDGKLKKLHDTGTPTPFDRANPKANPWGNLTVAFFFHHDKQDASTEILGFVSNRDEFSVRSGTMIVGRGSRLMCGTAASFRIAKAGKLVLLDGAMVGKYANEFGCGVFIEGTATGGRPDRPLKRDARIGIPYDNWMHLPFDVQQRNYKPRPGGVSGSLSGKITCYPAPNSNARVVIGWSGIGSWRGHRGWKMTESFYDTYAKLPPKITLWVGQGAEFENVRFDNLHRGAIVLPDANAFKSWKNVTFGDGCLSKDPSDIFREFKDRVHRGQPRLRDLPVVKKYISM